MIGLPSLSQLDRSSGSTRIWLAAAPAAMRCGFDLPILAFGLDPDANAR